MGDPETKVMDALVEFVLELDAASLPPAVAEAAGRSMMDWLGTAIRGAKEPLAGALGAVIGAAGGEPQATIVGRGVRTSTLLAALANGAQSHALDFDDTHLPSIVHGSAPVAPVVQSTSWSEARRGGNRSTCTAATRIGTTVRLTACAYSYSWVTATDSSAAGETATSSVSHPRICARMVSHHAWPPVSASSSQTPSTGSPALERCS